MKRRMGYIQSLTRFTAGVVFLALDQLELTVSQANQHLKENQPRSSGLPVEKNPPASDQIQEIFVGLAVDLNERVGRNTTLINRFSHWVGNKTTTVLTPIFDNRLAAPVARRFSRYVERGEQVVTHWRTLGKSEIAASKKLAAVTINRSLDRTMDELTDNPQIKELVQSQSASLAAEIVEEVRERNVSADNFLENLIRQLLRRKPRPTFIEPPPEVIEQAKPHRQYLGRVIKR